jgi:hypothetical protein
MRALPRIRNEPDHAPPIGGTAIAVEQLILRAVGQFVGGSELLSAARAVNDLDTAVSRSSATLKAQSTAATSTATANAKLAESAVTVRRATIDAGFAYQGLTDASARLGIATELLNVKIASGTAKQSEIRAAVTATNAAYRDATAAATAYARAQDNLARASTTAATQTRSAGAAAATSAAETTPSGASRTGLLTLAGAGRVASTAVGVVGIAAAAGVLESIKLAGQLDDVIRKVIASSGQSLDNLEKYRAGVIQIQRTLQSPQNAQQIAGGLYPILSTYGQASSGQALSALQAATKGATAANTDTATLAEAVTRSLSAYGESLTSFKDYTDILVRGIQAGGAEAGQAATAVGAYAASAKQAGVSFKDAIAAYAQLSTIETPERAGQSENALVQGFIKPTAGAAGAAATLGLDFSKQHIEAVGLLQVIKEIIAATNGANQGALLAKLFPNQEAARAIAELGASGNLGSYAAKQAQVNAFTGASDQGYAIATSGPQAQLQAAAAKLNTDATELGKSFLPLETASAKFAAQLTEDIIPAAKGLVDAMNATGNKLDEWSRQLNLPDKLKGLFTPSDQANAAGNAIGNLFSGLGGAAHSLISGGGAPGATSGGLSSSYYAPYNAALGGGPFGVPAPAGGPTLGASAPAVGGAVGSAIAKSFVDDLTRNANRTARALFGGGGTDTTPPAYYNEGEGRSRQAIAGAAQAEARRIARQQDVLGGSGTGRAEAKDAQSALNDAQAKLALDEINTAAVKILRRDADAVKKAIAAQPNVSDAIKALQSAQVDKGVNDEVTRRQQEADQKAKIAAAEAAQKAAKAAATRAEADNLALQAAQIYEQSVALHKGSTQALLAAAKATHEAAVHGILDTTKAGSNAQNTALAGEQVRYEQDTGGIKAADVARAQAATAKALQGRINSAQADLESATLAQQAAQLNHLSSAKQLQAAKAVQVEADRLADLANPAGSKGRANAHLADALQYQSTAQGITGADTAKAQQARVDSANLEVQAAQLTQQGAALHHASSAIMNQAADRVYQASLNQIAAANLTGLAAENAKKQAELIRDQSKQDTADQAAGRQLHELQNQLAIAQTKGAGKGVLDKDEARIIAYELANLAALGLTKSDVALQQAQYAQSAAQGRQGLTLTGGPAGFDNNALAATRGQALFQFGQLPNQTPNQLIALQQAQIDQQRQIIAYLSNALKATETGNHYLQTMAAVLSRQSGRHGGANGGHVVAIS